MSRVSSALHTALELHRSGNLERAEAMYRHIVADEPSNADAHHLLGVAAHHRGDRSTAIQTISKAIEMDDSVPLYHSNLGLAYRDDGQLERAAACFQTAIRLQPDFAEGLHNLGTVLKELGRPEDASEYFEKAFAINPDLAEIDDESEDIPPAESGPSDENPAHQLKEPETTHGQAFSLQRQERFDESVPLFEKAILDEPGRADLHFALAYGYLSQARSGKARGAYERGLQIDSGNKEAWNQLGTIFITQEDANAAANCFRNARKIDPQDVIATFNLGNVLKDQGQFDKALELYDEAIANSPKLTAAYINRGVVLRNLGRLDEAIESQSLALQNGDRNTEAGYHRAQALLANGDYKNGWVAYETRWEYEATPRRFSIPVWDGSSLNNRSLLIYAEQGIGDEIMFASCVSEIVSQTRRCVIECDERLVSLFSRSFPLAEVVPSSRIKNEHAENLPENCDLQIAMGSLPRFCRNQATDFPNRQRYLAADPQLVRNWQARLAELGEGLKVGISWRGGNSPEIRKRRSTTLKLWKPILEIPGIQFINLQYGDCAEELDVLRRECGVKIHDWDDANPLRDLEGFTAQISALDGVISIDNSTVHLAGGLGVEVWTLLPFSADFRWMTGREDSPWYPSMRLYRQPVPWDWNSVFCEVIDGVRRLKLRS